MSRLISTSLLAFPLLASVLCQAVSAADADPCTRFKWDVSRERTVMQQTPQAIAAAVKPGAAVPQLNVGTLYSLKLADEAGVRFAAGPAKASHLAGARAGLAQFRLDKPGLYRVSIASGLWVDVVAGGQVLPAVDFQGHVGCERPHKIVEFDLPARRTLILQFSGSSDAEVIIAITAVAAAAKS